MAEWAVEVLVVSAEGDEESRSIVAPGVRRPHMAVHGEVWRARAVRPGHVGDRRLMLEHRVGAVPIRECNCPQPEFVDCKKPPFMGPRWSVPDPVAFRNEFGAPIDLYWHNGTCEELISWSDVGGVQPGAQKLIQSTHGHNFRIRSAADKHMLMQHTLDDLVVYGCDEEETRAAARDLGALATATAELQRERDSLAEDLASQLARLILALKQEGGANATATAAAQYALATDGTAAPPSALQAGAAQSLLGAGFTGLLKVR
eukprot:CAMPEP_0119074210 /NCGR_PEP_ID=MMETSP1178-20130426/71962_1 /TAXON_ID=33656 /ORGANISM="unid sp, Strain CCMP2000" /LENGTH=259 /DNA_ID=CAMNT_0007056347 /DNA_START=150 /DNA_END=929 /DNA_ORIENTATION=-